MTTTIARSPRRARPAVPPLELGLIGEPDGVGDVPGVRLSTFRGERARSRRRGLIAGFATLALTAGVAGILLSSSLFLAERSPSGPVRPVPGHPFEVPEETRPASIIMEVRGDPIMIVRREDARPRPVRLDLPASLADAEFAIPTALRVADRLISESGGFMGRLPEDASTTFQAFADEGGLAPTAEDIAAVLSPGATGGGDMTVAEYTLLEADIPSGLSERVSEDDIAALVRATAIARGWVRTVARPGGRASPTAAVLRELGTNTSRIEVAVSAAGRASIEEVPLSAVTEETLSALLARNGFEGETSGAVEARFTELYGVGRAAAGSRLFVRARRHGDGRLEPMQVSLYESGEFVGAVARADDGTLVAAEEPAFDASVDRASTNEPVPEGGYTVRDGIYSAAMRNAMPEPIVREAITVLARAMDLSAQARPGDQVDLVYTETPRDPKAGTGRVLYVRLVFGGGARECYVFRIDPATPFGCLDASGAQASAGGMVAPVKGGRLTSKFGMRVHPILKYARLHKGIDWGAPLGTPVMSVLPGTLAFVGVKSGYGNYVMVQHDSDTVTAYAHLDRFEPDSAVGQKVAQGQRIGYLGTTGLSSGPHLHFEVYYQSQPVDPLTHDFGSLAVPGEGPDPTVVAAFADRKAAIDRALASAVP